MQTKSGTPDKGNDPGPEILAAIGRGKTPRDRVGIAFDQIQRHYAVAQTEGAEGLSRWGANLSKLKMPMLNACFATSAATDTEQTMGAGAHSGEGGSTE